MRKLTIRREGLLQRGEGDLEVVEKVSDGVLNFDVSQRPLSFLLLLEPFERDAAWRVRIVYWRNHESARRRIR